MTVVRITATWSTSRSYGGARLGGARLAGLIAAVLMLAVQLIALVGTATPARSAPGDRPVEIVIESITPEVGAPGTVIEIRGRFVNTTDIPVTDLSVRLQRGAALDTRTDLADNDSDPVEANDSSTRFVELSRTLAGSGVLPFTYTTTPEELRVSASGAYPVLVNVNGRAGSDPESRVGEQVILLPYFAQPPTGITGLSWLWPLVATPERNAAGVFTGSELAESLGPAGRLDQALAAIEKPPEADGSSPAPDPVTLAVDPALLEEVQVLAAGDYQVLVGGQQQTSSAASTDAANWLTRLRALAANLPVVPLPYADPDLAALISRGERPAVERLLPDGASGGLIQEILGVSPDQSIAWPPDGSAANPAVMDTVAEHGASQVIAEDRLTFFPGPDSETLGPISTLQTQSGPITALVGDHVLSGLLQADLTEPGAQAMAQQRFLAELVVIAAEGSAQPRHLLLTPARDFDPATAGDLMAAAATQPWLATEQVVDLDAAVSLPVARTVLSPAPESRTIPDSQLAQLIDAMRARDDFASAMTDPDTDLLALDRALARAATSNRGPDPARGDAAVRDVAAALTALGATVGILAPANGTYSLASADAPLVLTVLNNNPFTVEVTVRLAPRGAPGVTTTNVVQVLPAQARTTIPVPANVQRSGSFTVIASISSPAGSALGTPVQLRVQSTVYGPVALAITFGAAALLALLFARRSVKYWRGRRQPSADPDAGRADARLPPGASDAPIAEPLLVEPPPRSPV